MAGKRSRSDAFGDSSDDEDSGRNVRARTSAYGSSSSVGGRTVIARGRPDRSAYNLNNGDGGDPDSDGEDGKRAMPPGRVPIVERDSFPTTIKAQGRKRVIMNQGTISSTCRVRKDLFIQRMKTEDRAMLVPRSLSAGQQEVLQVLPGEIALQDVSRRSLAQSTDGHDNSEIFTAVNGLHKSAVVRVRGIVAGDGDGGSSRRGDDAVAIQAAGSNSTIHTGSEAVRTGDDLLLDILPYMRTRDDSGQPLSCIEHKGAPVQKLLPQIIALRCGDIGADLARVRAEVERIGSGSDLDTALAAVDNQFRDEDVKHGSVQSLRNYAILYTALFTHHDNTGRRLVTEAIAAGLDEPAVADHQAVFGAAAGLRDDAVYSAGMDDADAYRALLVRNMALAEDRYRDRLRRMSLGRCLKGGSPGQQIDVAFGLFAGL